MAKIILRVADNVNQKSSAFQKIKASLGENIEEEVINLTRTNLNKPYQRRMQALFKAFELCLIILKIENPQAIMQRYQSIYDYFFPSREELAIETLQNNLAELTSFLVRDLMQHAQLDERTAADNLEVADKLLLSMEERPQIATLRMMEKDGKKRWLLRWDKPLPSCSSKTLDEFNQINECTLATIPDWFNILSIPAKAYLQKTLAPLDKTSGFFTDINYLIIKVKTLNHLKHDFPQICWGIQEPAWFKEETPARKALIREILLENPEINKEQFIEKLEKIYGEVQKLVLTDEKCEILKKIKLLPHWFVCLPPFHQRAIAHLLQVRDQNDVFHIASRARGFLPGVANCADTEFTIFDEEALKEQSIKQTRLAYIVPGQLILGSPSIARTATLENIGHIFEEALSKGKMIYQTLLSPVVWEHGDNDTKLDGYKTQLFDAFSRSYFQRKGIYPQWFATNHPLNPLSKIIANDPTSKLFLEHAELYLKHNPDEEIHALLQGYQSALNDNNQLLQSSYENLLALRMGFQSFGGCKNNQDRKGVELIHTATLLLFRVWEDKWPNHANEEDRKTFCELFAELYADLHMLSYAESQGTFGLKNVVYYLPKDLQVAIQKRMYPTVLEDHHIMAMNIEVAEIKPYRTYNLWGWCQSWLLNSLGFVESEDMQNLIQQTKLQILQLDFNKQLDLLILLKKIVDSPFWAEKKDGYFQTAALVPTGISYLRKQLEIFSHEESSYQATTNHILACLLIIKQRPMACDTRRPLTQKFYDIFLYFNKQDVHGQLRTIYVECYKNKIAAKKGNFSVKIEWLTQLSKVVNESFWDRKTSSLLFFGSETIVTPPLISKLRQSLNRDIGKENAAQVIEECLDALQEYPLNMAMDQLEKLHVAINSFHLEIKGIETSIHLLKSILLVQPTWSGSQPLVQEDYEPARNSLQ